MLERNKEIKVVIVDLIMPNKDELSFVSEAKERFQNVAHMILTGYSPNEEIMEAIKSKIMSNYLSKPFDINSIVNAIDKSIADNN